MTPDALRDHYGADDFGGLSDDLLARAIERGWATINRYIPHAPTSPADAARVNDVWLTLARAYAYDDQALTRDHPVVRELNEALGWLKQVGAGAIRFSLGEDGGTLPAAAPRVAAPAPVFGDTFEDRQVREFSYWRRRG